MPEEKIPPPLAPDRRQALVAAAYRQIADVGFEGLRTREVAAAVGINVATLHYYFPSKEILIRDVLKHAMERFRLREVELRHGLPLVVDETYATFAAHPVSRNLHV